MNNIASSGHVRRIKRNLIKGALATKGRGRRNEEEEDNDVENNSENHHDDDDDDNDNDDDGIIDDEPPRPKPKTKRRKLENFNDDRVGSIPLPGGRATIDHNKIIRTDGRNIGALPKNLTYYIRQYLDILFGAVETERIRLFQQNCYQSDAALPNVISCILQYNNITFKSITLTNTKIPLPEPLWYDIDLVNNHLSLFLYQPLYDTFCTSTTRLPVIISSGIIKLEDYNPIVSHPLAREQLDMATYNCAIMADHTAQHIISDLFLGSKKVPGADIHDHYNDIGTTLHSMLDITAIGVQDLTARCNNNHNSTNSDDVATSYFTLLGGSNSNNNSTSTDSFPFTYTAT
nr:putative gp13-like protein [Apis mellifera nudivirus]